MKRWGLAALVVAVVTVLAVLYLNWPARGAVAAADGEDCVTLERARLDAVGLKIKHGDRLIISEAAGLDAVYLTEVYNAIEGTGGDMPKGAERIIVYVTPGSVFLVPIINGVACAFYRVRDPRP